MGDLTITTDGPTLEISTPQSTLAITAGSTLAITVDEHTLTLGVSHTLSLSVDPHILTITDPASTLTIGYLNGQDNTLANAGSGVSLVADPAKVGSALQVRGVKVGSSGLLTVQLDGDTDIELDVDTDALMADLNPQYEVLLDEVGSLTYIGEATPGTATSAAGWRIFRLDETGSGDEELLKRYADDVTTFTKTWDDRASYNYA